MIEIRRRISAPFPGLSGSPATEAEPAVGANSVPSVRTVVVFPAPFGPRNPKTSPWPTSNERSWNATRSPKHLVRPLTDSAAEPLIFPPDPIATAGGVVTRRTAGRAGRAGADGSSATALSAAGPSAAGPSAVVGAPGTWFWICVWAAARRLRQVLMSHLIR